MSNDDTDLIAELGALKDDGVPRSLLERALADAAFEAARRDRPQPSEFLTARVRRDAERVAASRRRRDAWSWSGLAAACVMGVAVGFTDPGGYLDTVIGESETVELAGGYGFQYTEVE